MGISVLVVLMVAIGIWTVGGARGSKKAAPAPPGPFPADENPAPAPQDEKAQWEEQATPYTGPLPWDGEPGVQEKLAQTGATVLMAAFKATLHEPIANEAYNIALAAEQLAGTVVASGQVFSQNQTIGPYTEARGYRAGPTYMGNRIVTTVGGGVCKISSLLYNVTVFSQLKVVERHAHSLTVPYVPPGQDATVFYGVKDFKFKNTSGGPVVIWARFQNNTLYMAMYGTVRPPAVRWRHEVVKRVPYWTEYRYNPDLQPGEERVVMPGMEGIVVRTWIVVDGPDGPREIQMPTDYYDPSPRVIEKGSASG